MRGSVVAAALEGEKLLNRGDRRRVCAPNADFPAPRAIDHIVRDGRAARLHHGCPGDDLRVYLEGLGEVAGAERLCDIAHVLADGGDAARVSGAVAIEDDAPAIGKILEDVGGAVLVHAHYHPAAFLHGGEVRVRGVSCLPARSQGEHHREEPPLHD
jgi:hypothetical protein